LGLTVPSGGGWFDILELVDAVPFAGESPTATPLATSTRSGKVKTDRDEADPVVATKAYVDEEVAGIDLSSRVAKSGDTMTGVLKIVAGSAGAPSLAFADEPTTGMYRGAAGRIHWSVGGTDKLKIISGSGLYSYEHLLFGSDNTYDIGNAAGTNRPRYVYATGGFVGDSALGSVFFGVGPTNARLVAANNNTLFFQGAQAGYRPLLQIYDNIGIDTSVSLLNGARLNFSDASGSSIYGEAAGSLGIRNGANAQRLSLYNTFTDGSNYERLGIYWSGNKLFFGTEKAGSGATRSMRISPLGTLELGTGGMDYWYIPAAGHWLCTSDNAVDIGASGASRPRNVYVAGTVNAAGNMYATIFFGQVRGTFWADSSATAGIALGSGGASLRLAPNSGDGFNLLQFGGTTSASPALKKSGAALQARLADDSAFATLQGRLKTDTNATAGTITCDKYLVLYDAAGASVAVPCGTVP
jgi:hypothetical protein